MDPGRGKGTRQMLVEGLGGSISVGSGTGVTPAPETPRRGGEDEGAGDEEGIHTPDPDWGKPPSPPPSLMNRSYHPSPLRSSFTPFHNNIPPSTPTPAPSSTPLIPLAPLPLSLDTQSLPLSGYPAGDKQPTLGFVWTSLIAGRIRIRKDEIVGRRWISVVFADWTKETEADEELEVEVWEGGVRSVREGDEMRRKEGTKESAEQKEVTAREDEDEQEVDGYPLRISQPDEYPDLDVDGEGDGDDTAVTAPVEASVKDGTPDAATTLDQDQDQQQEQQQMEASEADESGEAVEAVEAVEASKSEGEATTDAPRSELEKLTIQPATIPSRTRSRSRSGGRSGDRSGDGNGRRQREEDGDGDGDGGEGRYADVDVRLGKRVKLSIDHDHEHEQGGARDGGIG